MHRGRRARKPGRGGCAGQAHPHPRPRAARVPGPALPPRTRAGHERRHRWRAAGPNGHASAFSTVRRYPGPSVYAGYPADWRRVVDAGIDVPVAPRPDWMPQDTSGLPPKGRDRHRR